MNGKLERFFDLYLRSPFYHPVRVLLSQSEADSARVFPGFDHPDFPVELLTGPPDEEGFAPWGPAASPITERMTTGFENYLGVALPPLFKEYLKFKCVPFGDFYAGALPDIDPRRPLAWLEWCAIRREQPFFLKNPRYTPLTHGPARIDQLCFDHSRPTVNGDYAIVMVRDFGCRDEKENVDDVRPVQVFESFEAYFDFLTWWLEFLVTEPGGEFEAWLSKLGRPFPPAAYHQPP
jgi:hypothetical protein